MILSSVLEAYLGTDETRKLIGNRIVSARLFANMSQSTLCEKVGVNPSTLSKWEHGHTMPNAVQVKCLATELRCSSDYLLGMSGDMRPPMP